MAFDCFYLFTFFTCGVTQTYGFMAFWSLVKDIACFFKASVMDRPGEHWQNRLLRLYESVMSFTAASPLFTAVIKIFWDINNFKSIFSLASTWSKSSKSRKGFSLFGEWIYVCSNSRAPLLCIQKKPGLNSQAFTRTRSCCWHLFSKSPWTIPQNGGCAFTTFLCKRGLT